MEYEHIAVILIPSKNNEWELVHEDNYQIFGTITIDNNKYIGIDEYGDSVRGSLKRVVGSLTKGRGLLDYQHTESISLFDSY